MSVNALNGHATVLISKDRFKLLTKERQLGSRNSYWVGGAVSPTGKVAISIPSSRMLFNDGVDYDSKICVLSKDGRFAKVIDGAPLSWIDDDHLLSITTQNNANIVRCSDLHGKVSWSREGVVWASVFGKNLAVVEKDDLSERYKLVLFGLPDKKFVKEYDLNGGYAGSIRSVMFLK